MTPNTDTLLQLLRPVTDFIGGKPLDAALGDALNREFPPGGPLYTELLALCRDGTRDGWICAREHGGIRYGRVLPPQDALGGFSCDIVLMKDVVGPRHTHPAGEIDLNLPIDGDARFDSHPAGWLVYGPQTTHRPTVSSGESYVLYLLPNGEIEFH
ncbi:DUF4863 family protein [Castellaniella sp.]|uniref:4-hydroxylaminobenzoate lyase n=1 Tax=Castellaniella sp. TaxID=1955812 RepID=UPI002AFE6D38|nr:DUF4863 family protein [Castellaniella sp.]